jgi:hypothetical protein
MSTTVVNRSTRYFRFRSPTLLDVTLHSPCFRTSRRRRGDFAGLTPEAVVSVVPRPETDVNDDVNESVSGDMGLDGVTPSHCCGIPLPSMTSLGGGDDVTIGIGDVT